MTLTEARYIYACLGELADRMSRDGCNDWEIKSEADRDLAVAVEAAMRNAGDEPQRVTSYGPSNWLVPLYLQKRLVAEFGDELKCSAHDLGL